MEGTLATEPAAEGALPHPKPLLETWAGNERMRHVPPLAWIIDKLDGDIRRRVDILLSAFQEIVSTDGQCVAAEDAIRSLCRSVDRLTDLARHSRGNHAPADVSVRLTNGLNHALTALRALDGDLFGRRYPMQTFERSKAEPVYTALAAVICRVKEASEALLAISPAMDDKLYANLVQLSEPLRSDAIA